MAVPEIDPAEGRTILCRVCWDKMPARRSNLEIRDGRTFYRCQSCDGSFLVRWDDVLGLTGRP